MALTMNQANLGVGNYGFDDSNMGWKLPEFGLQRYVSKSVESIFMTIHRSFDYHSKATTRELITFLVFAVLLQGALVPTETYTTAHANLSMMLAAVLTDLVVCVIPGVALIWRWMK